MRHKRENTGRNIAVAAAGIMTLLLILVWMFYYFVFERARTLRASLEKLEGPPVSFSVDSGFFEESFLLELKADRNIPEDDTIEIRYTVNGDDPTGDSLLYKDGIDIGEVIRQKKAEEAETAKETAAAREAKSAGDSAEEEISEEEAAQKKSETAEEYSIENQRRQWEQEKNTASSDNGLYVDRTEDGIYVIPVRARLVQGEDTSAVVTRTYVVGPGVFERYDGYVVCLSTDSSHLFDYDKGIMVRGSHYWKDLDKGIRKDRCGNYYQEGAEWTKDGHVTLFSPEGEVLLEEDTGIEVGGFSSRNLPAKTLRIVASPAKGSSDSSFALGIFTGGSYSRAGNLQKAEETGTDIGTVAISEDPVSFQKIRFRTHGIPQYHNRSVRNEYAKIISDASGFPGLAGARLGVAFLNGQFYTDCDVTPSVTRDYMCRIFNLGVPDAIERYDTSDYDAYKSAKILNLFNADLTQTENQKALENAVDMDNYLFYFALEVLFNNSDWPFNNVTMWRYNGEQDPGNPYSDGRFRFLLDDMDQILTNDLHSAPEHWSTELIDYLMRDEKNTFYHVMACRKYRDTFLTYVDDLLRTTFEPDYACAVLDALYTDLEREYILDYGQDFWAEMEDTAEKTKNNVREKEGLYRADIAKYMGLQERYHVSIEAGDGVSVSWNNMIVGPGRKWSNQYYRGTSFAVTAKPMEGYRFIGWEINGEAPHAEGASGSGTQSGETLVISDSLSSAEAGSAAQVTVRALTEPIR